MKKLIFVFVAFLFIVFTARAQGPIQDGETQVNLGVGLSTYGLPIYAGIEFGLENNFSVGGEFSYRKYNKYSVYSPSITTIAGFGNYHFNELLEIPSQWDLYGGLTLGYSIWSNNNMNYNWYKGSGIYLAGQIGGRYYINDNFAVNLEFGGGTYSGGKLGVTIVL